MGSYERDGLQDQNENESELLCRIMNASACTWEHPEMIQRAIYSCLRLQSGPLKTVEDILNSQLKVHLIKFTNKSN
jgi:hypothetical protein